MSAEAPSSTRLKFWGVRGSIPVPGPTTIRYGGNTSCVEVRADGKIIVLDAGTGIRLLGLALENEFKSGPIETTLLLTHAHWDHIQGLPFFSPIQRSNSRINVRGYDAAEAGLREMVERLMSPPFFPVTLDKLPGKIDIEKLDAMEFSIGDVRVRSKFVNHPGTCAGYRLFTSAGSIAFLPDNEPFRDKDKRSELVEFLQACDVLIIDAQYTDNEYQKRVGWGHGSFSSTVHLALDANVRRLVLFHHDPTHDDAKIDMILEEARQLAKRSDKPLEVDAAREGVELVLDRG